MMFDRIKKIYADLAYYFKSKEQKDLETSQAERKARQDAARRERFEREKRAMEGKRPFKTSVRIKQ